MIFPHRGSGLKKTHESWHETTIIITMHKVGNSPLENLQIPTIHQQIEERGMGDEQRLQFSTQFVIDSDAKSHTSACVAPDCPNWSILPDLFRGYNSSCYGRIHRTTLQSFWITMCQVVNQVTHFTVVGPACSHGNIFIPSPKMRNQRLDCCNLSFETGSAPHCFFRTEPRDPGGRSAAPVALFRRAQCLSRKTPGSAKQLWTPGKFLPEE